jgi:hypothetical protein
MLQKDLALLFKKAAIDFALTAIPLFVLAGGLSLMRYLLERCPHF